LNWKYYPRPISPINGRSCRGRLCSAFELESTVFHGATISCGTEDGVELSLAVEDGAPIQATNGTT